MIRHDTNSSRIFMQNQPTSDVRPSKTKFLVLPQPIVPAGSPTHPRRWRRRPRRIPGYHGGQSENGMGYGPGYEPTHLFGFGLWGRLWAKRIATELRFVMAALAVHASNKTPPSNSKTRWDGQTPLSFLTHSTHSQNDTIDCEAEAGLPSFQGPWVFGTSVMALPWMKVRHGAILPLEIATK